MRNRWSLFCGKGRDNVGKSMEGITSTRNHRSILVRGGTVLVGKCGSFPWGAQRHFVLRFLSSRQFKNVARGGAMHGRHQGEVVGCFWWKAAVSLEKIFPCMVGYSTRTSLANSSGKGGVDFGQKCDGFPWGSTRSETVRRCCVLKDTKNVARERTNTQQLRTSCCYCIATWMGKYQTESTAWVVVSGERRCGHVRRKQASTRDPMMLYLCALVLDIWK